MDASVTDARLHVAEEVRAMLARKRLSGRELARRLKVGQSWLHKRLAGEIPFDVGEICAVADLLDVPVESFFAGRSNPVTTPGVRKRSFWRRGSDLRFSAA